MNGVVCGLDMGAVMTVGAARGVDLEMLADVLPAAETAILIACEGEGEGDLSGGENEE